MQKRGYHHGNLREALLEGALQLIAEKGTANATMAEVARIVGVSPAAPYRHYRDWNDLLADIALMGFERFGAALLGAWQNGAPTPRVALKRIGDAYLGFARTETALFRTMFESEVTITNRPALLEMANASLAVLRMACDAVIAEFPAAQKPPSLMVALHIWAMSHGIANLFARPDRTLRTLPISAEDLLESGVLVYLDGLASPTSR